MKIRAFTYALALSAGLASAGALAQSAMPTLPPGQKPPAPNATPNTPTNPPNLNKSDHTRSDMHKTDKQGRHREANDNVPSTKGGGAAPPPGYPNSGGSK
jgi:hypothetical protein